MKSFREAPWIMGVFLVALVAGGALRFVFPSAIEFKNDEKRIFALTQSQEYPLLGEPSGADILSPPLNLWVPMALAKIFSIKTPEGLARTVATLSLLGLLFFAGMAGRTLELDLEFARVGLFAVALASVSPMAVIYHRKIWQPTVLPLLSVFLYWLWLRRTTALGAFGFGFLAILMGQIHMSGFFLLGGLALYGIVFDRARTLNWRSLGAAGVGAGIGSIPMIPWLIYLFQGGSEHYSMSRYGEWTAFRFSSGFLRDGMGIGLGPTAFYGEYEKFLAEPVIGGFQTHLVASFHYGIVALVGLAMLRALLIVILESLSVREFLRRIFMGGSGLHPGSEWQFYLRALFFGMGGLMAVSGIFIHRHYLIIAFPWQWVLIVSLFLVGTSSSQRTFRRQCALLLIVGIFQFGISAFFLNAIHRDGGVPSGAFGRSLEATRGFPESQE